MTWNRKWLGAIAASIMVTSLWGAATTFNSHAPSTATTSTSVLAQAVSQTVKDDVVSADWIDALPAALKSALAGSGASVGVVNLDTGQGWTSDDDSYINASIIKYAILEDLLLSAQQNGRSLTTIELSLATRMISSSDNDAATTLFDELGGASAMSAFYTSIGADYTAANVNSSWGLTKTTVGDQLKVVQLVSTANTTLTDANRAIAQGLLSKVIDSQGWGISAGVPIADTALMKNGWLSHGGSWNVNSIGYVTGSTNYAIVILTKGSKSQAAGITTVEDLSKIVALCAQPSSSKI